MVDHMDIRREVKEQQTKKEDYTEQRKAIDPIENVGTTTTPPKVRWYKKIGGDIGEAIGQILFGGDR